MTLVVLIALSVGVPIASAAGVRRTASVVERFRSASAAADVSVSLPGDALDEQGRQFRRLAAIEEEGQLLILLARPMGSGLQPGGEFIAIAPGDDRALRRLDRPLVLRGRRPDQGRADEVLVDEGMAAIRDLQPGDQFAIETMSNAQLTRAMAGDDPGSTLAGPTLTLTVAGIARFTFDAHTAGGSAETFVTTRAFVRQHQSEVAAIPGPHRVRLRAGAALGDFEKEVRGLFPEGAQVNFESASDEQARIEDAVGLQRSALVAFTIAAALAAAVMTGTMISRSCAGGAADDAGRRAVGFDRRARALAIALPEVVQITAGALGSTIVAAALSPTMPFGLAGSLEPTPGLHLDVLIVASGALLGGLVLSALAMFRAWRLVAIADDLTEGSGANSRFVEQLSKLGRSAPIVVGSQLALERGRGGRAVPIRSGVVAISAGLAGIIGVLTLDANLNRLVTSPSRYGTGYSFEAMPKEASPSAAAELGQDLVGDPEVAAITLALIGDVLVDGTHSAQAWGAEALKGGPLFTLLDGRLPASSEEVAVGPATERRGAPTNDARLQLDTISFRVVGHVLFPSSQTEAFDDGVLLTRPGMERLGVAHGATFLGTWSRRTDRATAIERVRAYGTSVVTPRRPPQIEHLDEVRSVMRLLAAFLGLLVAAALIHTVATTLRRRDLELAVLRTLGFGRAEVRMTVVSQMSVLLGLSALFGVPLGLAAGRRGWAELAGVLHVGNDPFLPFTAVAVFAASVAVVGGGVALAMATSISHRRSASGLRSF